MIHLSTSSFLILMCHMEQSYVFLLFFGFVELKIAVEALSFMVCAAEKWKKVCSKDMVLNCVRDG